MTSLPITTFIDTSTTISVGGAPTGTFGRGLLLTIDDGIAAGGSGKVRLFSNLDAVNTAIGTGDAYNAAAVWFGQDPAPEGLYIGRWATTDLSTTLTGTAPTVAANAAPLNSAAATFTLNGNTVTTDLSAANTFTAIATAIQTRIVALAGIFTGATFAFTNGAFVLTLAGGDAISPAHFGTATSGTDVSAALGMDEGNVTYLQGHDAETAVEAATECVSVVTDAPVAIMLAGDAPLTHGTPAVDTREALAAWAQAGDYMFGLRETAAVALTATDTTSHAYGAFNRNQGQVLSAFDNADALPEIAGLALLSAQNLDNRNSIVTLHNKVVSGVDRSTITEGQWDALEAKRCNVVAGYAGATVFLGGFSSRAGYWADAQWFLLWLKNRMNLGIASAQRGSRRMTTAELTDAVTDVLQIGVRNGGILPGGTVNASTKADIISTTGNADFDGTLASGYMLWIDPPTAAQRSNRELSWKAWLAPSEAIHDVTGDIILSG